MKDFVVTPLGAIQVLRNADGGGVIVVCQISREKSVTNGSTLLALRGGGWGSNFQKTTNGSLYLCVTHSVASDEPGELPIPSHHQYRH